MKINFSTRRVRNNISGARSFETGALIQSVRAREFPVREITKKDAINLCKKLDSFSQKQNSIVDYFLDTAISFGNKKEITLEIKRVHNFKNGFPGAQIVTLPFKCPVPIKTNYHALPDFGEMMFLYRLGKISKDISQILDSKFKIYILEETDALAPVFNISRKECKNFKKRLNQFVRELELADFIEINSLQKAVTGSYKTYKQRLNDEAKSISKNLEFYSSDIERMLPTMALSINTKNLSLNKSRKFIYNLFFAGVKKEDYQKIIRVIKKYLAFLNVHRKAKIRKKQFIQLSITPSKNRIGIRPTLKHIAILPHHGVPVIYKSKQYQRFEIQYYLDFLHKNKHKLITEVRDEQDKFLFYEVAN